MQQRIIPCVFLFIVLFFFLFLQTGSASPVKIVVSFTILEDMVKRVGKDHVQVTTLVGRNGNAHAYEPAPQDSKSLREADLLIMNGLEFETWMDRLITSSGYQKKIIHATDGIDLLKAEHNSYEKDHDEDHHDKDHHDEDHHDKDHHDKDHHDKDHHDKDHHDEDHHESKSSGHHHHGIYDPHAWASLSNGKIYVQNILRALQEADPAHSKEYEKNANAYLAQLSTWDAKIRKELQQIPKNKRKIITPHDAFQYFAKAYGLQIFAPIGMNTESEASAQDLARLIQQMRKNSIRVVFIENISDPRLAQQIARDGNGIMGGKLYSGALSTMNEPANTYLNMVWHNAMTIKSALLRAEKK